MLFEECVDDIVPLSEAEIGELFSKIDTDGNNRLDRSEIESLVQVLGFPISTAYVDDIFRECRQPATDDEFSSSPATEPTRNVLSKLVSDLFKPAGKKPRNYKDMKIPADATVTKEEFTRYCLRRDGELRTLFGKLDKDGDQSLSRDEIKEALEMVQIHLTNKEIDRVFSMVDADHNGTISYREFRKIFLVSPVSSTAGLFELWYAHTYIDNSDTMVVHMDLKKRSDNDMVGYYKTLFSGATAGAVSRTITAPLDRTKMIMQIQKATASSGTTNNFLKTLRTIVRPNVHQSQLTGSIPNPAAFFANLKKDIVLTANLDKIDRQKKFDQRLIKIIRRFPQIASLRILAPVMERHRQRMELGRLGKLPVPNLHKLDLVALWKGNGINVIKIAPETAFKFMIFDYFKFFICSNPDEPRAIERLVAGASAGVFTTTLMYPVDTVRTQIMTAKPGVYASLKECYRGTVRTEGYLRLYKGFVTAIIGVAPFAGIDLCIYEMIKVAATKHYTDRHNTDYEREKSSATAPTKADKLKNLESSVPNNKIMLLAGTVSSTVAAVTTYPLAVIRTRIMAQHVIPSPQSPQRSSYLAQRLYGNAGNTYTYNGLLNTIKVMYAQEGILSFYRGIFPNLFKVVPAVTISYLTFENTKRALNINT